MTISIQKASESSTPFALASTEVPRTLKIAMPKKLRIHASENTIVLRRNSGSQMRFRGEVEECSTP